MVEIEISNLSGSFTCTLNRYTVFLHRQVGRGVPDSFSVIITNIDWPV